MRLENIVIGLRRAALDLAHRRQFFAASADRPPLSRIRAMAGRVEIDRHLKGESAARLSTKPISRGNRPVLIGQPLQGGVGEDHVIGRSRRPVGEIGSAANSPARRWRGLRPAWRPNCPCLPAGLPASAPPAGAVELPGPQPRSITRRGSFGRHPGQQVGRRPGALIRKGQIEFGVPGHVGRLASKAKARHLAIVILLRAGCGPPVDRARAGAIETALFSPPGAAP